MIDYNCSEFKIIIPVESATNCDFEIPFKCLVNANNSPETQLKNLLPVDNREYVNGKPLIKGNRRNVQCPCGSGKKFKKCCMLKDNK